MSNAKLATTNQTCAFCYNKADSKEHVFPAWLLKRLPYLGKQPHAVSLGKHGEVLTGYLHRPGSASQTLKAVCRSCNNNWMGQLQYKAKPIIERMLIGNLGFLNDDFALIVSKWAAMTTVIIEFADYNTRTTHFYQRLKFQEQGPSVFGWNVAVGRFSGNLIGGFNHLTWSDTPKSYEISRYDDNGHPIDPIFDFQVTSFVIGNVAFYVYKPKNKMVHALDFYDPARDRNLARIFPFDGPPSRQLTQLGDIDYDRIFRSLIPSRFRSTARTQWNTVSSRRSGRRRPIKTI